MQRSFCGICGSSIDTVDESGFGIRANLTIGALSKYYSWAPGDLSEASRVQRGQTIQ